MSFLKTLKKINWLIAALCLGIVFVGSIWFFVSLAHSQGTAESAAGLSNEATAKAKSAKTHSVGLGVGLIGVALATGLSSLGAGVAVSNVGAAAVGAVAEKPESLGTTLIFVGLAEGIAIYGLIISILILGRL